MSDLKIPRFDANSDSVLLAEWHLESGAAVQKGSVVCTVESAKSTLDIAAEESGFLVRLADAGQDLPIAAVIGAIVATEAGVAERLNAPMNAPGADETSDGPQVTRKAARLAEKLGVDLSQIEKEGYITEADVRAQASGGAPVQTQPAAEQARHFTEEGITRVIVLTAGLGSSQVVDILSHDPSTRVVGCLDDSRTGATDDIFRVPVVGRIDQLGELWEKKRFDAAIVALSTNIQARKRLFEQCLEMGIPLINAIDPSVRINRGSSLGSGNIVCSMVHIGTCTRIGDNNFISAHCNIDHHNVWGNHNTLGPACATSALVTVESEVKFGSGVIVQPKVTIGNRCQIASGAVIIRTIEAGHAVKTKVETKITRIND